MIDILDGKPVARALYVAHVTVTKDNIRELYPDTPPCDPRLNAAWCGSAPNTPRETCRDPVTAHSWYVSLDDRGRRSVLTR